VVTRKFRAFSRLSAMETLTPAWAWKAELQRGRMTAKKYKHLNIGIEPRIILPELHNVAFSGVIFYVR